MNQQVSANDVFYKKRNTVAIYLVILQIIGILSCAWLGFILMFAIAMGMDTLPEPSHRTTMFAYIQMAMGIGFLILLTILPMVFCWRYWNRSRYFAVFNWSLLYWIECVVALYFYCITR